jgi:hypothetical protein
MSIFYGIPLIYAAPFLGFLVKTGLMIVHWSDDIPLRLK